MTFDQIKQKVSQGGKPVQQAQLYRYLKRVGIKSIGGLRPAIYPSDSASRIINYLGLAPAATRRSKPTTARRPALPTMETLRRAKLKAK